MLLKKDVRKNSSLVDIIYEEKLSNSSEVKEDKRSDLLDDALKSNFLDDHNEELKSLYIPFYLPKHPFCVPKWT